MFLRKHYFKRMYIRGLGPLGVDRSGHGPWRASVTIHTWGGGGHRVWWQDRLCPCSPRGVSRVGVHGLALLTLSHAVLGRESPGKGSPQAEEPCTGSRSEGAAAAAARAGLRGLPGTGTWWHVLSPPALLEGITSLLGVIPGGGGQGDSVQKGDQDELLCPVLHPAQCSHPGPPSVLAGWLP